MHWGLLLVAIGFGAFLALRFEDEPRSAWQFTRTPLAWAVLADFAGLGWRGDAALVVVLLLYVVLPVAIVALLIGRFAQGLPWFRAHAETPTPSSLFPNEASVAENDPLATVVPSKVGITHRLKHFAAPRRAWVAGGIALVMACGAGTWWYLSPRDPDFSAYESCLLKHITNIPASSPEQYQATLWQIRESCRRLHPVELDIEVLARARPGKQHWDEKVSEFLVDLFIDGWPEGVSPEGLRDVYFTRVILPRIHPDWEPQARELWNKRAQRDVDALNQALVRSRGEPKPNT